MAAFAKARVAAAKIFRIIDHKPTIHKNSKSGLELDSVLGQVEIKSVNFSYPARPDVLILNDFSLSVPAGKTIALVGSSGSGKSTVVSLIERFYDPTSGNTVIANVVYSFIERFCKSNEFIALLTHCGAFRCAKRFMFFACFVDLAFSLINSCCTGQVLLDGNDIKTMKLEWLREQIGLVSQEPALFATSIKENILLGRPDATLEEIEEAARVSNAHSFIIKLTDGYDTQVTLFSHQLYSFFQTNKFLSINEITVTILIQ